MDGRLIKAFPFSEAEVDKENMTRSLLQLLSHHHCISESYQNQVKTDLNCFFLELAGQYTRRASSSLSMKAAENIYVSVLFQADVYLESFDDVAQAAQVLCCMPIKEVLMNGQMLILQYYEEVQQIFKQVYKTKLPVPLQEYRYAIDKSFDDFLRNYDARFDAADIACSIDYPLLYGNWMPQKGILYIKAYYTALMHENEFCHYLKMDELFWALEGYGRKYRCRYTDLLFNIAEVMLNNLLAAALLKKEPFTLRFRERECEMLQAEFESSSLIEVESAVCLAFAPYRAAIKNPQLVRYLEKYLGIFSAGFHARIHNRSLKVYLCFDS